MRRSVRPGHIVKTACSLRTGEGDISFVLARSSGRRTLTITVDGSAQVTVSSPWHMREPEIRAFVHEKAGWIRRKVDEVRKNKDILSRRAFDHGHEFLFLGKKYKVNVDERAVGRGRISFDAFEGWSVAVPQNLSLAERRRLVKEKMVRWYRRQAGEILGGRVFHYSRLVGVEPRKIVVRTQKRLWGCCDYQARTIRLNWQIILSPPKVVDYVVVHELCHLAVPGHSRRFWRKVEKVMPDFKEYRRWLRTNRLDMVLP